MKMYNKTRKTDMLIIYYDRKDKKHYSPKTVRTNKWQPPPQINHIPLGEGRLGWSGQFCVCDLLYLFIFKKSHIGFKELKWC